MEERYEPLKEIGSGNFGIARLVKDKKHRSLSRSNILKEERRKNWVLREGPYGSEWAIEEKVKRREIVAPEARYIFVCNNANDMMDSAPTPLLGFLHYRFTLEEEMPVLYLYELQLDSSVQGKGMGKFLKELVELIAQENRMSAVVLSVQKSNSSAMKFYISKLRSDFHCLGLLFTY
ncbi:N-alpha-acetyltransferase 40-like [Hibiscus syriacus]|uniref:N-alpha-acetyltransferase 40-like n=1 Tax=Hibiscus syriacus TaxID=106335 RepID=UPI001921965E|nr:N-alpha-acetyltransferase 40-like [Hibiscus syriacus]